ncbi:uncharacterized protein LOC122054106 isoform X2 [Zingiber officinale]|uniref:uncharacterized protein LOC122054106 isoform X2 n=1 Tax=Zingiber officinale TaxID=94328 RepID=UPI001C4D8E4F|nr:uncharacterized protein LOC122054106 isoform X2 [Zingiber officinale]
MGHFFSSLHAKLHGKGWREGQLRNISDQAFDRVRSDSDDPHLTFEDLYISVLYVYNDINKYLPGPHNDPPTKEKLKSMMEYDMNLDGLIDREEFAELMKKLTKETAKSVGQNLLIGLVLVPTVALIAKRATEGVPVVGRVMQNLPNFVYASIVALGLGVVIVKEGSNDG